MNNSSVLSFLSLPEGFKRRVDSNKGERNILQESLLRDWAQPAFISSLDSEIEDMGETLKEKLRRA